MKKESHTKEHFPEKGKKAAAHKTAKNPTAKNPGIVLLIILLVLLVIGGIYYFTKQSANAQEQTTERDVVALVNGEPITKEKLLATQEKIFKTYGQEVNESIVLDQVIFEILLLQDAKEKGITTTDEEVTSVLTNLAQQQLMTVDQLKLRLGEVGFAQLKKDYADIIILEKLARDTTSLDVTPEMEQAFYDDNAQLFIQGNSTITFEQAEPQIKIILRQSLVQQTLSNLAHELRARAVIEMK
ncbi:SurA N-terminal domain-containing protein [Candidatus Woesearchaeota archaeon]|nr:SurA N-terminal domain-containing protein [Candidatus Woesearchaeota archaeon]HIH38510.1 hypothetical protein [Candidatus Woesearchaeota archaeon]HIJ04468.1 hypothetical protein [Candidatus Woesearchaeota archaeon]